MNPLKRSFGDFIEHASAVFAQLERSPGWRIPPFSRSRVFWLGEDAEFFDSVRNVRDDLLDEIRERIPMPFEDVSAVSVVRRETADGKPDGEPTWTLDRVIEGMEAIGAVSKIPEQLGFDGQPFLVVRYQMFDVMGEDALPLVWAVDYHGMRDDDLMAVSIVPSREFGAFLEKHPSLIEDFKLQTGAVLDAVAAISHPANYVVRVSPRLTPHEERRVAAGKSFPERKRPHFVVVDHEVITSMRRGGGTHASPVPHERRGHWRRLAERCRHAKLLGKDKVFVRPALVGDPKFSDEKNFYEVLSDFSPIGKGVPI